MAQDGQVGVFGSQVGVNYSEYDEDVKTCTQVSYVTPSMYSNIRENDPIARHFLKEVHDNE